MSGEARELSLHAARRIAENFHYIEVMEALQPRPKVSRLRHFKGPLPGIYTAKSRES